MDCTGITLVVQASLNSLKFSTAKVYCTENMYYGLSLPVALVLLQRLIILKLVNKPLI